MSGIRLAASALAFAGFALYGAVAKARLGASVGEVASLEADTAEFARRLRLTHMPLGELALAVSNRSANSAFWQSIAKSVDQGMQPSSALELAWHELSCEAAKPILSELFRDMGSADTEAEADKLALASAELGALKHDMLRANASKVKLVDSLSLLMGLAAALLLL